jgi:hypothetical protein
MRLLSMMIVAGLLSVPVAHEARASPVTLVVSRITVALSNNSIEKVYYYRGRYYPYRYRGAYYRHRYYRHGRYYYR